MVISSLSFLGGFVLLLIGLIDYALLRKLFYRPLQHRYEHSKTSGKPVLNPRVIWFWLWLINLLILPLVGFVFGHAVLSPLMAS